MQNSDHYDQIVAFKPVENNMVPGAVCTKLLSKI